jgi:hypothetical protein
VINAISFKKIFIFLSLCLLLNMTSLGFALEPNPAQLETATSWISAINDENPKIFESIVHPSSRSQINDTNYDYYEFQYLTDLQHDIPEKHQINIEPIAEPELQKLKDATLFKFPVLPTHMMQLNFKINKYSGVSLSRYICQKDGKWFVVIPHPTDTVLAQFRKNTLEMNKEKLQARQIVEELTPDFVSELKRLIQDGSQLKALNLLKESKDISIGVSKSVLDELKIIQ